MKFLDLVRTRQSVRKYSNRRIEKSIIEKCLEAARLAPSACNSQPWKYIIIDEPELKEKIATETFNAAISFNKFALTAPVIVIILLEKSKPIAQIGGRIKNKQYNLIDLGITAEHFCLQAAEEGLGTCMIGWFNEKAIKKHLNLNPTKSIGLLITLGYPGESLRDKNRKSIDDIRTFNLTG